MASTYLLKSFSLMQSGFSTVQAGAIIIRLDATVKTDDAGHNESVTRTVNHVALSEAANGSYRASGAACHRSKMDKSLPPPVVIMPECPRGE